MPSLRFCSSLHWGQRRGILYSPNFCIRNCFCPFVKTKVRLHSKQMQGNLDDATRELLAKDVIRLGMTPAQISAFKKVAIKCDYATAINRATGKIPVSERMEKARKATKDLVGIEKEIADLAFHFQSRLLMAEDLMPKTLLGSTQSRARIYKTVRRRTPRLSSRRGVRCHRHPWESSPCS